jgi:Na+-driven multidrug efflux pump
MKPLIISKKGILLLLIGGLLLVFFGTLLELNSYAEIAYILKITGCMSGLLGWSVLLTDVCQNAVPNKYLWIMGFIVLPPITFFYLFKRDELIEVTID